MVDAAAALRAWRARNGLSLVQASKEVGCDQSAISKIENRIQRPGRELAEKLEVVTGIRTEEWGGVVVVRKPIPRRRKRVR